MIFPLQPRMLDAENNNLLPAATLYRPFIVSFKCQMNFGLTKQIMTNSELIDKTGSFMTNKPVTGYVSDISP